MAAARESPPAVDSSTGSPPSRARARPPPLAPVAGGEYKPTVQHATTLIDPSNETTALSGSSDSSEGAAPARAPRASWTMALFGRSGKKEKDKDKDKDKDSKEAKDNAKASSAATAAPGAAATSSASPAASPRNSPKTKRTADTPAKPAAAESAKSESNSKSKSKPGASSSLAATVASATSSASSSSTDQLADSPPRPSRSLSPPPPVMADADVAALPSASYPVAESPLLSATEWARLADDDDDDEDGNQAGLNGQLAGPGGSHKDALQSSINAGVTCPICNKQLGTTGEALTHVQQCLKELDAAEAADAEEQGWTLVPVKKRINSGPGSAMQKKLRPSVDDPQLAGALTRAARAQAASRAVAAATELANEEELERSTSGSWTLSSPIAPSEGRPSIINSRSSSFHGMPDASAAEKKRAVSWNMSVRVRHYDQREAMHQHTAEAQADGKGQKARPSDVVDEQIMQKPAPRAYVVPPRAAKGHSDFCLIATIVSSIVPVLAAIILTTWTRSS